jgi:hypothetical protein
MVVLRQILENKFMAGLTALPVFIENIMEGENLCRQ